MDMKLEVVVVPVSDVDRSKEFYKSLGWRLDADIATDEAFRVVQLTPPGSPASIIFGTRCHVPGAGIGAGAAPDRQRHRSRARGAGGGSAPRSSEVFHDAGGVFHHAGTEARVARPGPGTAQLRLVPVVQRPGRQRLGAAGGDHPAAGPDRRGRDHLRLHRRPGERACGVRRPRTATTRLASATRTRTGRPGTRSTWCTSRPGPSCRRSDDESSEPAIMTNDP